MGADPGDPDAYVRTILVRQNVSRWRAPAVARGAPTEPPEVGVTDDGADDRIALQHALAVLAPRQRAVIVLRYYEDLTEARPPTRSGSPSGR